MIGFADETYIDVSSGNGGSGCVSFRREKYVPKGGPDGGDGGDGGDVVFIEKKGLKTLLHLKYKRIFRAQNGQAGMKSQKTGARGKDVLISVPPGTLIKDHTTGKLIKDLTGTSRWVFMKGGKGGKGNRHFTTSRKRTPRYAQPGLPGSQGRIHIELQIIADIGLVGLPNAGKSSLIRTLTNADPKVADYPFTTRIPHLGVFTRGEVSLVMADIPGIIEGASKGAGMGLKFLKHLARTRALLFVIDLSAPKPGKTFLSLYRELESYASDLLNRPRLILGSKTDLPGTNKALTNLRNDLPEEQVFGISVFSRQGLEELSDFMVNEVRI